MVNRWFGFLGSPYEIMKGIVTLGVSLESQNHQPKPPIYHKLTVWIAIASNGQVLLKVDPETAAGWSQGVVALTEKMMIDVWYIYIFI